jgi:hypothetical protein
MSGQRFPTAAVIAQSLLVEMYRSETLAEEKEAKRMVLAERYRKVKTLVESADGEILKPLPFNSGYFMAFNLQRHKRRETPEGPS